jgi:hypothetical protein
MKKFIEWYRRLDGFICLSRSDFDKVSNEIANPSEPSEKLVNAFRTNKSVIEDE